MPEPAPEPVAQDAGVLIDAPGAWPELAGYPQVEPERVIALPVRPDVPRFEVGGPVIVGDIAVVASSQFGFVGVDWRRGAIAWSKPAGAHVAPPLVEERSVVLVGDCLTPPAIGDGELLLGCMRVVTAAGADEAYTAIRGKRAVAAFAAARGEQALWSDGGRAVRWRRGEVAVSIDLVTGIAKPASAVPPPLSVTYKDRTWRVVQEDGRIVARLASAPKREAWSTKHAYTAVIGAVWLPDQSPLLRVANTGAFGGIPEIHLLDIDATGSLRATAARPTPGIGLLGWATSSIGDAAIVVRMDKTIRRDFVVGYAANAMLRWVHPLPEVPRADPVGIAVVPDAVIVFHDGDTLTILPELSAPPTAPGAGRAPSENPTP
jgi:hypothetical protein